MVALSFRLLLVSLLSPLLTRGAFIRPAHAPLTHASSHALHRQRMRPLTAVGMTAIGLTSRDAVAACLGGTLALMINAYVQANKQGVAWALGWTIGMMQAKFLDNVVPVLAQYSHAIDIWSNDLSVSDLLIRLASVEVDDHDFARFARTMVWTLVALPWVVLWTGPRVKKDRA
ncbi:unnamed protein product [Vitrella brassicaformis CCMP3155]|uniref:Uncharacterized protein n=1 Tax=Vitrella brassicaformis (strain CCMP3155) TaxID=1169540 RepID=A0A0G4GN44_VITBC|nr:unnamed protein product [Vitrella brassicaformis CCMP3155]|eukprot:CEM31553.1 unnamed protein product [Vitrella brassicaformis CCMP3155]